MAILPNSDAMAKVIVDDINLWLKEVVVRHNLCPFAAPSIRQDRLRLVVSDAKNVESLFVDLRLELAHMLETPEELLSTTILSIPHLLSDFEDYLGFLDIADCLLEEADLRAVIQIASFHPEYLFEGEGVGRSVYTNRAPYPLLHLIREEELARAVMAHPNPKGIPARNIHLLESLSPEDFQAICRRSIPSGAPSKTHAV